MINLLPPQQKNELVSEEKFRLSVIIGIVVISSLISLALILFALKFYFQGQLEFQNILLEQKISANPQIGELEKEIKNSNKIFSDLESFYKKEHSFTEVLGKISTTVPSGVNLNSLNVQPFEDKQYKNKITLAGFAVTRNALLEFKKNLENDGMFGEISFPSSTWVEATDIAFTVSFKSIK